MTNATASYAEHGLKEPIWTAHAQHLSSTVKPVKLIELGTGQHGKFVRIEFANEMTRPLYIPTMADAWHPIFDNLPAIERWKIRDFFNPFEPEILPDGNVKTRFNLSFVTRTCTKKGKFVSQNNFDVQDHGLVDDHVVGIKMAAEYMAALSLPTFQCTDITTIICDMAPHLLASEDQHFDGVSRSFLSELGSMLRFAAQNCNHKEYFAKQIELQEGYSLSLAERRRLDKEAFIDRIRTAKVAKLAAQSVSVKEVSMPN